MAYCEWWTMPDGTTVHMRMSGRPPKPCQVCGKNRHTKLCDYPTGHGRTCSKLLCDTCTTHIAPDSDYCPEHKDGPPSLFRGPQGFITLDGKEPDTMAEHHTKNTVEVSHYCKHCKKFTQHNVNTGRVGSCQECIKRLEAQPKAKPKPIQTSLF